MADKSENIIIEALPPATDYITYLTILEYNLTKAQLPLLHRLLQNPTLTINIGWDLVTLLVPLLPASQECLVDVARLGNPREVILKVAELLGKTGRSLWDEEDSNSEQDETSLKQEQTKDHAVSDDNGPKEQHKSSYQSVIEFQALLHMISIVHPRIKTKRPSRFLITSFEAILPAYARVTSSALSTIAVLSLIDKLCQSAKPSLPPRENNSVVKPTGSKLLAAPDPEGSEETVTSEERVLQMRLLRSFITHVIEVYVESLPMVDDSPGLAWTERYLEKQHPERVLPFHTTMLSRFTPPPVGHGKAGPGYHDLNNRDLMLKRLLKGALDGVKIPWKDVVWVTQHSAEKFSLVNGSNSSAIMQSTCKDFPLSRKGMLYILGAELASKVLHDDLGRPAMVLAFHFDSVKGFLDPDLNAIGTEPLAVLDTILLLGFVRLEDNSEYTWRFSDLEFFQYLQKMSLLSANAPSSTIRYHAHLMTSAFLHAYPSKRARFDFIQDTFESCPFENLLVCAVGWLKEEILAATSSDSMVQDASGGVEAATEEHNVSDGTDGDFTFASPKTLSLLGLYIFTIDTPGEHPRGYVGQIPFYMTALNLYYLLWMSPVLRDRLQVAAFHHMCDIQGHFIEPLRELCQTFRGDLSVSGSRSDHEIAEVQLLEMTVDMVRTAVRTIQSDGNATWSMQMQT